MTECQSYNAVVDLVHDVIGEKFADRLEAHMKAREMTLLLECMRIKAGNTNAVMARLMGWSFTEVVSFQEGVDRDITYPHMVKWCEVCGQDLPRLIESRVREMVQIGHQRCDHHEAEMYRERTLTDSIGLEGAWSEWKDGRPDTCLMSHEYEYRKLK